MLPFVLFSLLSFIKSRKYMIYCYDELNKESKPLKALFKIWISMSSIIFIGAIIIASIIIASLDVSFSARNVVVISFSSAIIILAFAISIVRLGYYSALKKIYRKELYKISEIK